MHKIFSTTFCPVSLIVTDSLLYVLYCVQPVAKKTISNTGNIFGPEDYDGAHWESIDIPCKINCSEIKFDPNKLRADIYPDWMDPVRICW